MSRHDVIVVGAGHNGLTAAALLARRGRKVVVVERREIVGGLAAGEEFHPGYRSAGLLHDTTGVRGSVVAELELEKHGLRLREHRPDVLSLGEDGQSLLVRGATAGAVEEIGRSSKKDAERYAAFHGFVDRVRPVLRQFLDGPALDLVDPDRIPIREGLRRALKLRGLGRREMMELLRLPPMCVADWLDEWFEGDLLKAALALPAVAGNFMGPRSPGSNMNLLLREAAAGPGVVGGGPALVAALEASARAQGVEIRAGVAVERIEVEAGRVKGVLASGGERIEAGAVVASCDPRHALLGLLAPGVLPGRAVDRMRGFRMRGTTAQVLLALRSRPRFAAHPDESIELARTAPNLLAIERAFDAVKYRSFAEDPVLEIALPTAASPDRAPAGHAVLSVLVHFAPYDLDPAWNDAERERLGERVMRILDRHLPGTASNVVAGIVLAPPDIEERYGVTGGHVHHGEQALDQVLIRPTPECLGHATPVEGLYLCSGGTHPGGGLTCAPAKLAAERVSRA